MKFECPECKQHLSISSAAAGLTVRCPSCNGRVQVPLCRKAERQAWKETVIVKYTYIEGKYNALAFTPGLFSRVHIVKLTILETI